MAHGFDIGAVIKLIINLVLNITISLIIYTDLKSLYNCLVRLSTTQKKKLMVNFMCLYQLYKRKEIAKIKEIKGNTNPANFIIKLKVYDVLKQLININKVNISVIE
jgi:hypothetical protein